MSAHPAVLDTVRITSPAAMAPPARRAALPVVTPGRGVVLLILGTLLARLLFAAALGLGNDESYMVAAGRVAQTGYFDHPPLAWWMAWAAARLAGTDAALVVRLPFILTFALTTWLMYRLTATLFDARAGLWAAMLLNVAPVFGLTTASWVLPDGPLLAALLAACLCLVRALPARGAAAWGWWLGAGAAAGLALFSKYTAGVSMLGAGLFLASDPSARRWLRRPHPYAALALALACFAPVLLWNARHGWISLLFQAGRASGSTWHMLGPVAALAGEALFLMPWIWAGLMVVLWQALRAGPGHGASWLLACLASPTILLFEGASLRSHVLFHWAAPGYLMLFPLLGAAASRLHDARPLRRCLAATATVLAAGSALASTEVRFDWLRALPGLASRTDPALEAVDWRSFAVDMDQRGYLGRPGLLIAATRWHDAGKLDYVLQGRATVLCLGHDPREYGLIAPVAAHLGADVLIVAPHTTPAEIAAGYGAQFSAITSLPPSLVRHAGRKALELPLYLGHSLRLMPPRPKA